MKPKIFEKCINEISKVVSNKEMNAREKTIQIQALIRRAERNEHEEAHQKAEKLLPSKYDLFPIH